MCFHLFLFLVLIQSILFLFFLIAFILLPSIQILLWFHGISSSDVWPTLIQTLDIYFSHLCFCPSCFVWQWAPLFLHLSHASHFHPYSLCIRLRRFSLLKTVNGSAAFLSQIFWAPVKLIKQLLYLRNSMSILKCLARPHDVWADPFLAKAQKHDRSQSLDRSCISSSPWFFFFFKQPLAILQPRRCNS